MATSGTARPAVDLLEALASEPHRFNFFQLVRRLEAAYPERPRVGTAAVPSQDIVRMGGPPSLAFASAPVTGFRAGGDDRPPHRVDIAFMGLFGPNGELPHEFTRYALRQIANVRHRSAGSNHAARASGASGRGASGPGTEEPFSDFVDMFNHRMLCAFYRAWRASRPAVTRDRPDEDPFVGALGSILGITGEGLRASGIDELALSMAGQLAFRSRPAEGLCELAARLLQAPVGMQQFVGEWLAIPSRHAWKLGVHGLGAGRSLGLLGESTLIGPDVYERQSRFRLVVGPVGRARYLSLLPGSDDLTRLAELVRHYIDNQFSWDLLVKVLPGSVQPMLLGEVGVLGSTAYLSPRAGEEIEEHLVTPPGQ